MFAQQRREFGYLYAYLLDACHIADSNHPLVIEHVRIRRHRISDIIPSHDYFDCEYFSRNGASSTWSADVVVKEDTLPSSSEREKEKKEIEASVLFSLFSLHAIVPQVYLGAD